MRQVNVQEAKTHLSMLLADVEGGEAIAIARAGKVIAHLVPAAAVARVLGADARRMSIAPDFDDPLPLDLLDLFEGS